MNLNRTILVSVGLMCATILIAVVLLVRGLDDDRSSNDRVEVFFHDCGDGDGRYRQIGC